MRTSYWGEVEVEDAAFTMEFERFIIDENNNNLWFQGDGSDEFGRFRFEGKGERSEGQYCIVPMLEYPQCPAMDGYSGAVVIEELRPSSSGKKCRVRGYWQQDEDRWSISAKLRRFGT